MKLIIAGSRHLTIQYDELFKIISNFGLIPTEIVSGGAPGIDTCGEEMAEAYEIKLKRFPANWTKFGLSAGHKRNLEMAIYSDVLVLLWDGKTKGSANMKARMKGMGKPVFEVIRTSNE